MQIVELHRILSFVKHSSNYVNQNKEQLMHIEEIDQATAANRLSDNEMLSVVDD